MMPSKLHLLRGANCFLVFVGLSGVAACGDSDADASYDALRDELRRRRDDITVTPDNGSFVDAQGATWRVDANEFIRRNDATVGDIPGGAWQTTTLVFHRLDQRVYAWGSDDRWYVYDDGLGLLVAAESAPITPNPPSFVPVGGPTSSAPAPAPEPAPSSPTTTPPTSGPTAGDFSPPGNQVQLSPSNFDLSAVGAGNTAVLADGYYSGGFTVPNGVTLYSPNNGGAIVSGNITCSGTCNIVGLTIDGGVIDLSGTDGARISRNTFHDGNDRDGLGTKMIWGLSPRNASIDHNHFEGGSAAIETWNLDDSIVTQNTFVNIRQGVNCNFSTTGHGRDTYSKNYFTGTSRMAIECTAGGDDSFFPVFTDIVVDGNWTENLAWNATANDQVVYSIVGGQGGINSTITNNTILGPGFLSIGVELNQSGIVTGNKIYGMGWTGVEVYGPGFDVENNNIDSNTSVQNYRDSSGIFANNEDRSVNPPRPETGPTAP